MTKPKPKPDVTPVAVVEATEMVATTQEAAISIWKNTVFWNTVIGAIVTIVLGYFQTSLKQSVDTNTVEAKKSAVIAQESAVDAADNRKEVTKVVHETHDLVNHQREELLGLYSVATRRAAELSKDPVDIDIADKALKAYSDHVENQNKINAAKAK